MGVETFIAIFLIFSVSTYLLMQTKLTDFILGFCLLSTGVNLFFLLLSEDNDLFTPGDLIAPLTQTLLVSAIVIRFALIALVVVVAARLCANLAGKERSR